MNESVISKQEVEKDISVRGIEDIEKMRKAVAEARSKAEDYRAKWGRSQTDLVNLKKRTEHGKEGVTKTANMSLIISLLPILDDLERALETIPAQLGGDALLGSIKSIYHKLQSILEIHGVSQIKSAGEIFDPHFHEAVMCTDGDEGMVIREILKGYTLYDRVIRASNVIVGNGKISETNQITLGINNTEK